MKRLVVPLVVAGVLGALAGPASAIPNNKNTLTVPAICNGEEVVGTGIAHTPFDAALFVVGDGPLKVISFTAFDPVTGEAVFEETTQFPKEPNVTCTGTFTLPGVGTVDFELHGYLIQS
jgi:hypothetical protein